MGNSMLYKNNLILELQNAKEIVIYGAGIMGKAVKRCLEEEPYHIKIKSFIVQSLENNSRMVENVPVVELAHADIYKNNLLLVALHEKYVDQAVNNLMREGFLNIVPITFDSDVWSDIRGNWFYHRQAAQNIGYMDLQEYFADKDNLHIYIVRSVFDRKLKEQIPEQKYEIQIQAGAALTDRRVAFTTDHAGENISEKNRQFCELTALYWIWKHDNAKYIGLSHYRRRFQMDEQEADMLVRSDVDAVLTVPVINFPDVRSQYEKDHDGRDWDIMIQAILELAPEYRKAAELVQNGIYYYAYNMFIARKELLNTFCSWLFPILFYCEKKIGQKDDDYQNRYIGFLAERLLTIFFVHNTGRYKTAIAKKHFIEAD